jgi:hypothetical protein
LGEEDRGTRKEDKLSTELGLFLKTVNFSFNRAKRVLKFGNFMLHFCGS